MLSDKDIKISLENKEIEISPIDEAYNSAFKCRSKSWK